MKDYGMGQALAGASIDPRNYANQAICDEAPTPELVSMLNRLHGLHDQILGSNNMIDGVLSRLGIYADTPEQTLAGKDTAPSSLIANLNGRINEMFYQSERLRGLAHRLERLA
jgi:hypothetical protein